MVLICPLALWPNILQLVEQPEEIPEPLGGVDNPLRLHLLLPAGHEQECFQYFIGMATKGY